MAMLPLTNGELLGLPGCGKSTVLVEYARHHGTGAVDAVPAGFSIAKLANMFRGLVRLHGAIGPLAKLCVRHRRLPLGAIAVLFERAGRRAALAARASPVLTDEGLLQACWAIHWRTGAGGGLAEVVSGQVKSVIYITSKKTTLADRLATRGKDGAFDRAVVASDTAAVADARRAMAQLLQSLRAAGRPIRLVRSAP